METNKSNIGEWGVVVEASSDKAKVRLERKSICEKCGLCLYKDKDFVVTEVVNKKGARKGDKVKIQLSSTKALQATFIMFMIPLISLLTGILIGYLLSKRFGLPGFYQILIGFIFFGLSFLFIRNYDKKIKDKHSYQPTIVRVKGQGGFD
ncbi:SoxR reducing system RseC family protein [Candidatus Aerophobetes bacterium]|nr:SoxR reducing system RseC family protein [Candidatus Aerophobetes bacterium]